MCIRDRCDSRGVKVVNEVFNPEGERERERERERESANGILLVIFVGVLERHLSLNSSKKAGSNCPRCQTSSLCPIYIWREKERGGGEVGCTCVFTKQINIFPEMSELSYLTRGALKEGWFICL